MMSPEILPCTTEDQLDIMCFFILCTYCLLCIVKLKLIWFPGCIKMGENWYR